MKKTGRQKAPEMQQQRTANAAEGSKQRMKAAKAARSGGGQRQRKAATSAKGGEKQRKRAKAAKSGRNQRTKGSEKQRRQQRRTRHRGKGKVEKAKDGGRIGIGIHFSISFFLSHEANREDEHRDDIDIDILTVRTPPPPSRYIDLKLSDEGAGGGTYFPEAAR